MSEWLIRRIGRIGPIGFYAWLGPCDTSSYQQRVHQRWLAFLSSSEYSADKGSRLTAVRSSSLSSAHVFSPRFSQRGQPFLSLILNYSFTTNLVIYWRLSLV